MRKNLVFVLLLSGLLNTPVSAQSTDLRELFLAAESYYLFEEFDEALPLYLRVYRQSPDNDNISFKIGVCYLNNPYEKEKSIFYLEKASQNISPKYKDNNFKETDAPLEVLYYLGNAYRVNNMLDKAKESYNRFLDLLDTKIYDDVLVKEQLKAVEVAENLMKKPVDMDVEALPGIINSRFADKNPVLSGNEQHLVFVSRLQFYDAVFYSEKVNGEWTNPRNIIPELEVDGDVFPTSLSWDGTELYVYRNDNFIGNIYSSRRVGDTWTPLQKLNDNINTKYWESHACINKDGNLLYFASNRIEGYGGLDIYLSQKMPDGTWGTPVNLGPTINTKYNEDTPFITEDGSKLFFSSYGHYNMGGYDVFMSIRKEDGTWAEPRNLGYPINSTDDDLFFNPVKNGTIAYYPRYKEDGFGRHDIYRYKIYGPDNPRQYLITGYLDFPGETTDTSDIVISVNDPESGKSLVNINPYQDGSFQFEIPAGSYDLIIKSKKFIEHLQKLEVSQSTPHSGIIMPGKISLVPAPPPPVPVDADKMLTLKDTLIEVDSGDKVRLRFDAERGSTVIINVYNDSLLISSDTIDSSRRRETFDFQPLPGTNIVEFILTDKDGNTIVKKAEVIFKPRIKEVSEKDSVTAPEMVLPATSPDITETDSYPGFYRELLDLCPEGNLKNFLENIDLEKEEITTREELISYLQKNAGSHGYTQGEVCKLMSALYNKEQPDEFLQKLLPFTSGNLREFLSGLDLEKAGIKSVEDLIDYILHNAEKHNYQVDDLWDAIINLISSSGEATELKEAIETKTGRKGLIRSIIYTGFVFLLLGVIILFLIWKERRKKKKNELIKGTGGH